MQDDTWVERKNILPERIKRLNATESDEFTAIAEAHSLNTIELTNLARRMFMSHVTHKATIAYLTDLKG